MSNQELQEQLLSTWIRLNAILKDSRMTRGLTYNEAVVMNHVYQYRCNGISHMPIQQLLRVTNLLKSQMNRTVDALCSKGLLIKAKEGRQLFVSLNDDKIDDFLEIHNQSLSLVQSIIDVVGEKDAREFVRICAKLADAGLTIDASSSKGELL